MSEEGSVVTETGQGNSDIIKQRIEQFLDLFMKLQNLMVLQFNLRMVKERALSNTEAAANLNEKEIEKIRSTLVTYASGKMGNFRASKSSLLSQCLTKNDVPADELASLVANHHSSFTRRRKVAWKRQQEAAMELDVMERCEATKLELQHVMEDDRAEVSALEMESDKKSKYKLRRLKSRVAVLSNVMRMLLLTTEKLSTDERLHDVLFQIVEE